MFVSVSKTNKMSVRVFIRVCLLREWERKMRNALSFLFSVSRFFSLSLARSLSLSRSHSLSPSVVFFCLVFLSMHLGAEETSLRWPRGSRPSSTSPWFGATRSCRSRLPAGPSARPRSGSSHDQQRRVRIGPRSPAGSAPSRRTVSLNGLLEGWPTP